MNSLIPSSSGFIDIFNFLVWGFTFLVLIVQFMRSIRMVPTKSSYVVERLGKYSRTLGPGFHALLPFLDKVSYIQSLKEEAIDVPPQECFTRDNVKVEVDGVMYIMVENSVKASYGVTDYRIAAIQLAQTTIRSVIGTLELDRTFEERNVMSSRVVETLAEAGQSWGIKVNRYEIKNIIPPHSVTEAMEKQVSAERERRAIIAKSEGVMQAQINKSEGIKMQLVNQSEGEKQKKINEAEGKSQEVFAIAQATAESIEKLGSAIAENRGEEAIRLQLSQKYLQQLGQLAKDETEILLPADITNLEELLKSVGLS
ncbi:MAG: paraslipin [Proteobacteria bacterium]|nr:paraslipin [Pseudomonadota bacterium]